MGHAGSTLPNRYGSPEPRTGEDVDAAEAVTAMVPADYRAALGPYYDVIEDGLTEAETLSEDKAIAWDLIYETDGIKILDAQVPKSLKDPTLCVLPPLQLSATH